MKNRNLLVIVLLLFCGLASCEIRNKGWWKHAVFYQVYPRSFKDSNGDGVGDLAGVTSKLNHFKESGITAIWLSPINKSPMVDFGYDISDFRDVDPIYGNLNDLENLISEAHKIGLKVILDLVPNHTSDKHAWFQLSLNSTEKYKDYYIWSDGIKTDPSKEPSPPNNWVSVFNGSAWTYSPERKQLYFHQFYKQQPDLNYNNEEVQQEMKNIMEYWLDKKIDGFRIDAVPHLFEGNITENETRINVPGAQPTDHVSFIHNVTKDQPKTYELVQSWRKFVDEYADKNNRDEIVLMTEAYTSWNNTLKYYNFGSHIPFNFKFITDANANSDANQFKNMIDMWVTQMPNGGVANWVMGNHDRVRIATRYPGRADQMTMLAMILPGVAVTYYGEEIGMEDNTTIHVYDFRDGCRTPFQWDDSTSAGFSVNKTTWLPVHSSYKTINLAQEKKDPISHYKLYTGLTKLRESEALQNGNLSTTVLDNKVLAVIRKGQKEHVTLLINFSNDDSIVVDMSKLISPDNARIELSNVGSGLAAREAVTLSSVKIPAKSSMILVSGASVASYSILSLLLFFVATFY